MIYVTVGTTANGTYLTVQYLFNCQFENMDCNFLVLKRKCGERVVKKIGEKQ